MQKIRTSSNADVSFCGRLRREDQVGAGWEVGADGRSLMVLIFIPLILLAPLSVCLSVCLCLSPSPSLLSLRAHPKGRRQKVTAVRINLFAPHWVIEGWTPHPYPLASQQYGSPEVSQISWHRYRSHRPAFGQRTTIRLLSRSLNHSRNERLIWIDPVFALERRFTGVRCSCRKI